MSKSLIPGAPAGRPRATRQVRDPSTGKFRAARPRERRSATDRFRAQAWARLLSGELIRAEAVGTTAADAQDRAVQKLQARLDAERGRRSTTPTLREAVEEWLAEPGRSELPSVTTAKLYERAARRWLLGPTGSSIGALKIDAVHPHDVSVWLAKVASSAGLPTARTARTVLSSVFRFAISQRLIAVSPTREASLTQTDARRRRGGLPGPSVGLDKRRAFSTQERDRLISAAEENDRLRGDDLADLLVFVGATGVRIGEALALHWEDVDFASDERVWVEVGGWTAARVDGAGVQRVVHGATKRAVRRLALPAEAGAALRDRHRLRRDETLVFGSPLNPANYREVSAVTKRLRRILDQTLGDDGRPMTWASSHTLRRTIVTQLHAVGTPSAVIADQTGHRDLRVLEEHYIARTPRSSVAADLLDGGPSRADYATHSRDYARD